MKLGSRGEIDHDDAMSNVPFVVFGWAGLLSASCEEGDSASSRPSTRPSDSAEFYGRVIDAGGNGVEGARVEYMSAEMARNRTIASAREPNRETQILGTALTGNNGEFHIDLPPGFSFLEIKFVGKQGCSWVRDLTWNVGDETPDRDNLVYYVKMPGMDMGSYFPDVEYPAIFPLHKEGDPRPTAAPSRGGSEMRGQGIWYNGPVPPLMPSAGPEFDPSWTSQYILDV